MKYASTSKTCFGEVLAVRRMANRLKIRVRDGRPAPRGTLPAGKGGSPPRTVGRGVFPAPPSKNDQNRGEVAGQNKGPNLNFLQ